MKRFAAGRAATASRCRRWLLAAAVAGIGIGALAAHAQPADEKQWHVLIEPSFMRPPVTFPIPGAERTVLVPGYRTEDGEVRYFTRAQYDALGLDWPAFQAKAAANKTDKKVKATFARNKKGVVEFATFASEHPLTATSVLVPEFRRTFEETFGPKMLVAVPNRYTVYIFPALASTYRDYAPMILEAYRATPYPVSVEVFELSENGLRAIGIFED